MILEQNFRKISQYTQRSFKLYSRRYLAQLMLQILRNKQNITQIDSISMDNNKSSALQLKESQVDQQNVQKDKEQERNSLMKTMRNFQRFDKSNLVNDLSNLKYGDFIFLEIYNSGMNLSDKSQRLRAYLQLGCLKYAKIVYLQNQLINNKTCIFQIINPYDPQSEFHLNENSIFCLRETFSGKYLSLNQQIKISTLFGYDICLKQSIGLESYFQFTGIQAKSNNIVTYQPLGLKLSNLYLRAEQLDICCSIQGSVFYMCKVPFHPQKLQSKFVKIKTVSSQKFLSSSQIDINKLLMKRTFSNVTIEDENNFPIKENQLVFATLDFNKVTQSDIQLCQNQEESLKNVWIFIPIVKQDLRAHQEIKIIHASSGRCLVVKNDKTLKLSSIPIEASSFTIRQNSLNQIKQDFHERKKYEKEIKISDSIIGKADNRNQNFEIIFEQKNLCVERGQEQGKFNIAIANDANVRQRKIQQNQFFQFQISPIKTKNKTIIQQLIETKRVLQKVYNFIQKLGFILDERSQSLKFTVEEIKKSNHQILYHNSILRTILDKINEMLNTKRQFTTEITTIQNYIKELKILEVLICIIKIMNLKMGKRKHFAQGLIQNQNQQSKNTSEAMQLNSTDSPFEVCWRYYGSLQDKIFDVLYLLVQNNTKCSNVLIQQSSFFNKLLITDPVKVGIIMHETIKNLSLFTTRASSHEGIELFQWAKLIQTVTLNNIKVQKTYIDIIAEVVIDPNGQGIVPYQNKCKELLFSQRNKKKIIPQFGVEDQRSTISFESINLNDFLYCNPGLFEIEPYSSNQACFFIEDFFYVSEKRQQKDRKNTDYVNYIMSLIRLMRNLCKDRNKKLIKVADEYGFDKAHIISSLNSPKISWLCKMQYLLLYNTIYLDQDPFLQYQRREVKCHIWTKISEYNLENKTALLFKQYTDLTSTIQKLKEFDADILPFVEAYLVYGNQNISKLFSYLIENEFSKWNQQISLQLDSFNGFVIFLFQTINFGYLNIFQIKRYVNFVINHYQSICNLFEFILLSRLDVDFDRALLMKKRQLILNQILRILVLNENLWVDINCINLLKIYEKKYTEETPVLTGLQFRQHCWKLLNHEMTIMSSQQINFHISKSNTLLGKKKTTTKNMLSQERNFLRRDDKSNQQFDTEIGKFLIRLLLVHNQMSHLQSYHKIISVISLRQKRNQNIYDVFSSFLILNGKKQQNLYRDYSGRTPGKILNVNKISELVIRIKNSSNDHTDDPDSVKKIKEKLLQLNNLVSKIKRELVQMKEYDIILFKKMQQIIQKLNIDFILLQLLQFSDKNIFTEFTSNLYKFFLEFIWDNDSNKIKLCGYFQLFLKNIKVQRSAFLISELYLCLNQSEKRKYMKLLFEKARIKGQTGNGNLLKEGIIETIYRILRKMKEKDMKVEIKSQLTFQLFRQNEYSSLLDMEVNLSTQYVNVLCQLGTGCRFVFQKIRKLFPKNNLRKLLLNEQQYIKKYSILKLYYYFYLKENLPIQTQQFEDLISSFILPQIQHLPSVTHYLALQNLQIKPTDLTVKKSSSFNNNCQSDMDIAFLKKKFQNLIILQKTQIQPSQQQKYWNFIYNLEDESQMSLINFTIQLFKIEIESVHSRNFISKTLCKSAKYQNFINYLGELCEFLKKVFQKNSSEYQRRVLYKLQQILIMNQERNQNGQNTVKVTISEQNKTFMASFFQQLSAIIVNEEISYRQILKCANVTNSDLGRRRSGQNIQKMFLEQQFISFVRRLGKHTINTKQFNSVISEKKLSHFFNLYRSKKYHKMNIYKFLQKLIEYLESLKLKSISQINNPTQGQRNEKNPQLHSFDYVDMINNNQFIQTHFVSYYKNYEIVLKILLLKRWRNHQQKYFRLVLDDLKRQSINENFQLVSSEKSKSHNFLIEFYLSQLCGGNIHEQEFINYRNNSEQQKQQQYKNNMFQIDLCHSQKSATFSGFVLMILKQVNSRQNIRINISYRTIVNYIVKKIEQNLNQSSHSFNLILKEIVLYFSKSRRSQFSAVPLRFPFLFPSSNFTGHDSFTISSYKNQNQTNYNSFENFRDQRSIAFRIYQQILSKLDKKIGLILNFNFQYTMGSCLEEFNYIENHIPQNFKIYVQILSFGLANGFICYQQLKHIENCFMKIFYIWAQQKFSFSDLNWLLILQSIVYLIDEHFTDLTNFAKFFTNCPTYLTRYHQLIEQVCCKTIKSTNLDSITMINLLNLLTKFHFKFYLENQKDQLAKIFNEVNFTMIASTAHSTFESSLNPKLQQFQNQVYCNLEKAQHKKMCTFQFCNEQNVTKNDNLIMETFVTLLIIIQMSITFYKEKLFKIPLKPQNHQTLNEIEQHFKTKTVQSQKIDWVSFYKRLIGLVYFYSQDGTLITLHFKIPYIERYSTKEFKQQALYLLKTSKQSCIQKKLQNFSKYFESQLEQRKIYQGIPFLSTILSVKKIIKRFIILVNFIHVIVLLYPSLSANVIIFYPFTFLFIFLRSIFTFCKYKKALNIIACREEGNKISLFEKLVILMNEKVLISCILIGFYIISFFEEKVFAFLTILQIITLREAYNIFILLLRTFIQNLINLLFMLGAIMIFLGLLEWQKGETQQFSAQYSNLLKQFYTFTISNMKTSTQYDYQFSKQYPYAFILFSILILLFIYKNIKFFLTEMKKEKDINNQLEDRCIICRKKKIHFQNQNLTFQDHVRFEHNIWYYLYFFIHLRRQSLKQNSSLNKTELSIKQKIDNKKYGFINI